METSDEYINSTAQTQTLAHETEGLHPDQTEEDHSTRLMSSQRNPLLIILLYRKAKEHFQNAKRCNHLTEDIFSVTH